MSGNSSQTTSIHRYLVEEVRSYLGLNYPEDDTNRLDLGSGYMKNYIDNKFGLKITNLVHHDNIMSAFAKIHHTMYLNDPKFMDVFGKELLSRAVPRDEIEEAASAVDKILDDVVKEFGTTSEQGSSYHPKLNEVIAVSRPEQPMDFQQVEPREGHTQKRNVK